MSTPEQSILNILQDQVDPLTSNELAECSGLTQTEVLKALGELNRHHNIVKSIAGYKLLQAPPAEDAAALSTELRPLLTFFTRHNKAFLPKALREELGWDKRYTAEMLSKCKQLGLVLPKNNGVYYLSPTGVQYVIKHYPDVEVKAFVLDKAKEQALQFQIVAPHVKAQKDRQANATKDTVNKPHPAVAQARAISASLKLTEQPGHNRPQLTEVPVKIQVLDELAVCFGNDVQIQLQQLSGFLREYARG